MDSRTLIGCSTLLQFGPVSSLNRTLVKNILQFFYKKNIE